jgi:hypothetical protein
MLVMDCFVVSASRILLYLFFLAVALLATCGL